MKFQVLDQLQWHILIDKLSQKAQTEPSRKMCRDLQPTIGHNDIEKRWAQVLPLKTLFSRGYRAPIGELPDLTLSFRAASLGQILNGEDLWDIFILLQMTQTVRQFTVDQKDRCQTLSRFHGNLYPLPGLSRAIQKAISTEGEILDTATPTLEKIRRDKVSARRHIESKIKQLLTERELETYLQDKFFTIRADRYVVPIRLDGRGRVDGSIHDTSDSGQTLYIEPLEIKGMNENLLELELAEKLEILKIFKELSDQVAAELEIISANFDNLIELDFLTAQACLAHSLDAGPVELTTQPILHLRNARHPLITTPSGGNAIANDIMLTKEQRSLIVSGPNAGGKTVVLKTTGLLHLMAKAGLLIPADENSKIYLFEKVWVSIGDSQNLSASLSTFSGHIYGLKTIVESAGPKDLVLLDELAVGTEPQAGAAIAQAILEKLAEKNTTVIATTHFDNLKGMAVADPQFRNGSMEYSTKTLKPTYHLIMDVPGQSYGIEVAKDLGFPLDIIARATDLRGSAATSMDKLIEDLSIARDNARKAEKIAEERRLEMESQKARWTREREGLSLQRQKASKAIADNWESKMEPKKQEINKILGELKKIISKAKKGNITFDKLTSETSKIKVDKETCFGQIHQSQKNLAQQSETEKKIPGIPATIENTKLHDKVWVISLGKEAMVTRFTTEPKTTIEVQAGHLKLRPPLSDLRLLKSSKNTKHRDPAPKPKVSASSTEVPFVVPTNLNTLDLRGLDSDSALNQMWSFIDKGVLSGENLLVVIHGHGTDKLKNTIRTALVKSPYQINFRPGDKNEGGDGVTVVQLIQ